jgi:6-phosphogluconolactonase
VNTLLPSEQHKWHELADADELANALSHALHSYSLQILSEQANVLIALAGGSTPMAAYAEFAQALLPWSQMQLTLIDERFVPITDAQSNEGTIASAFSAVKTQLGGWHGLMHASITIEQAAARANQDIQALQQAIDIAVIGMGSDGHIASLFVESADYQHAMDVQCHDAVLPIRFAAQDGKVNRLSFSLAELLKAKKILICITGDEKRRVLEQSLNGSRPDYAVAHLLKHYSRPIEIFWSPA